MKLAVLACWLGLTLALMSNNENTESQRPHTSFEHEAAYITVRIFVQTPEKLKQYGTGFFYHAKFTLNDGSAVSRLLLISNKHVFSDPTSEMRIKVNRRKEDGSPAFGDIVSITFNGFADQYYPHPNQNVDLACVDVTHLYVHRFKGKQLFIKHLADEFLTPINYEKVALGSDVLFIGYPSSFYDTRNNLPVARKGSLSSIPYVDFEGRGELVIDADVFPGSSGSPVFVDWDGKYRLLGVLARSTESTERFDGRKISIEVKEHIGLGIVVKQRHVKELIDHVSETIRTKIEAKQGQRGNPRGN